MIQIEKWRHCDYCNADFETPEAFNEHFELYDQHIEDEDGQ
jgi:hypothetical protein